MQVIVSLLVCVIFLGCTNTQQNEVIMNDTQKVQETVIQLFVNTDKQNWNQVEAQFDSVVQLDYSSMTGNPATSLTPNEITKAWKTVLPGFDHTHHQLGNFIINSTEDVAHVFCYGTATHYLENDLGNVWTVLGMYDFDLKKVNGNWKITTMTFNYKYQDGNTQLVQKAIEKVKNK